MKKITNFIIDKRHFILIIFIIFTIVSALLSQHVNINYDISKYLPDDSETRIGMNIMESEFAGTETSTLNIMFEDLQNEEKMSIKEEIESISGVKNVDYDDTENYNKDQYTLYVVTVDDKSDSKTAAKVYDQIIEKYENDTIYTSGDISEANQSVLPLWIIALAVLCALIILLIMCDSFIEPFLFLSTILMAVAINKGTNIIFPSVSHITDSIVAILQMALSMDYSIMLMNRYNQEKEKEKDKVKAMKSALHQAFQSISSSSLTTIVGLLALVFMSFKIGKDLGFILAKGVLFSLICIFFVLPSLILMFDNLIMKTKKKRPPIKLNILGKLSYKCRWISLPVFLLVFIASFLLKGNLGIDYTDRQSDQISKVFKENNQIAIIYKNEEEEKISKYLETLENKNKITEVLGYGNTIHEKLTYDQLNHQLTDLGSDISIEDYLLRIIYYNYYNQNTRNQITFDQFIQFIEEEAYNNPNINKKIDENIKKDITRLKNFVTESQMNQKRSASEIANILEFDQSKIEDILIYYLSKNNDQKLSLDEFVQFMNHDVLTNEKYQTKIDNNSKNQLKILSNFTNKTTIQKKLTANEIAQLFGIDANTVHELYKYYILLNDTNTKMTTFEFSNFILNNVLNDENYKDSFSEQNIQEIQLLSAFSNKDNMNKEMNSKELTHLFGIEEDKVKQILLLKYLETENTSQYKIIEFINYLINIKNNTNYLENVDISALEDMKENPNLQSDQNEYTVLEMTKILNMDASQINMIYNLIDFQIGKIENWVVTPLEFVDLILENSSNERIQNNIDETTIQNLTKLQRVMISSIHDTEFTNQELANMTGIDQNTVKNIYTLYIASQNNTTMTPLEFVTFILEHQNDTMLHSISNSTVKDLTRIKTIMNSTLNNQKYDSNSLSSLLGMDQENLDLLYGLYQSLYINKNQTISLKDFIDFILNDVVTNSQYASNFDQEKILKLKTVSTIMQNSLNNTKYTADEIFDIIHNLSNDVEKDMIEVLYIYYGSNKEYDEKWEMTVEEFVNYLNNDILKDERFTDFIEENRRKEIIDAKTTIHDARQLLIGKNYSRVVLNTKLDLEGSETFDFTQEIKNMLGKDMTDFYVIGDSPMAYEMSKTFNHELDFITVITMIFIFIVVAITFKSIIIPIILVLTIQCAVYLMMGILSVTGENVYFIALLIVQSILMGATIDYAILYTSYYLEHRKKLGVKESIIESYNKSIHTILTSSSILIIVTLIIACFTSAIAAKICKTISQGTICSTILILVLLPAILAFCDKLIVKNKKN